MKLPDYDFINFCYREFLDLYSGFLSLFFSVLDCHKSHIFELYSVSDVSAFCCSINNPLLATRQLLNLHSTEFNRENALMLLEDYQKEYDKEAKVFSIFTVL